MTKAAKKVLFLADENPFAPVSEKSPREVHLVQLLSELMETELLCFSRESVLPGGAPSGLRICPIELKSTPLWRKAISMLPVTRLTSGADPEMVRALKERASPEKLLWVSKLSMAPYLPLAQAMGYKIILDQRQFELHTHWAGPFSPFRRLIGVPTAVVTTSDLDASRLLKMVPRAPVHVIPDTVDASQFKSLRSALGKALAFQVDWNYAPHLEAIGWFVSEILPRLRAAMGQNLPPVIFSGRGQVALQSRQLLEAAGVIIQEQQESSTQLLAHAAIVFVPIHQGRHHRIEILEAMAAGRAVVSTGRGAEGLVLTPTHDIWIADQPDAFTTAIVRLLRSRELLETTAQAAAKTVDQRYSWDRARPLLANLLSSILE